MAPLDPDGFNVAITRTLGRVVVRITGELDSATAPALRDALVDLIDGQGNLDLVLEVSKLSFIDSAGLGVLIAAARKVQGLNGELTLSAPTRPVAKVLQETGVERLFAITRT